MFRKTLAVDASTSSYTADFEDNVGFYNGSNQTITLVGITDQFDNVLSMDNTTDTVVTLMDSTGTTDLSAVASPVTYSNHVVTGVWPHYMEIVITSGTLPAPATGYIVRVTRKGFLTADIPVSTALNASPAPSYVVIDESTGSNNITPSSNVIASSASGLKFSAYLNALAHELDPTNTSSINIANGSATAGINTGATSIGDGTGTAVVGLSAGNGTAGTSYNDYWYYDNTSGKIYVALDTSVALPTFNVGHQGFVTRSFTMTTSNTTPTTGLSATATSPAYFNVTGSDSLQFALVFDEIDSELEAEVTGAALSIGATNPTLADFNTGDNSFQLRNFTGTGTYSGASANLIRFTDNKIYIACTSGDSGTDDGLLVSFPGFVDRYVQINGLTNGSVASGAGTQKTAEIHDGGATILGSDYSALECSIQLRFLKSSQS